MRVFLLATALLVMAFAASAYADEYKVAVEDILIMNVWGEPQLSGVRLIVDPDGNVTVPVVGQIKAEGLSPSGLAQAIRDGLKAKDFLLNAQVQILLHEIHRPTISVLGSVNRPGKFEFKEGDTVMEAIAQAGSYHETANLSKATLTRKSGEVINIDLYKLYIKGDSTQNLLVKKGDTILIPEDTVRKIYVLGEVQRPGMYVLKDNTTALSAISQAGGAIQDRGKLEGTTVIRGDPANPEKIKVDIGKMIKKGDMSQDVVLRPGDLVYVPKTSKPSLREIGDVLGILSNFRLITQGFRR
ncbi:MAG: polysaccharide biosynthesis/export family protein [Armatimonadota bacterium]|nr:polysaccharide biosynthesis/export family protein [Armatimonadota bacterium]